MMDTADCVVLGDGIAGLTAATLLAKAGLATVLVAGPKRRICIADLLFARGASVIDRLGVLDALVATAPAVRSGGLRMVDACGCELLAESAAETVSSPSLAAWHVPGEAVWRVLESTALRSGVDRLQCLWSDTDAGCTPGVASVEALLTTGERRTVTTPIIVASVTEETSGDATAGAWSVITGRYRGIECEGIARRMAIALQASDRQGWCTVVPLGEGLATVSVVHQADDNMLPVYQAGVFEERLIECPSLLERMHGAELVGDLNRTTFPAGSDPWCALHLAGELQLGQALAERAVAASLERKHCTTGAGVLRICPAVPQGGSDAVCGALFDDKLDLHAYAAEHPQVVQRLRDEYSGKLASDFTSLLPDDAVILTRV